MLFKPNFHIFGLTSVVESHVCFLLTWSNQGEWDGMGWDGMGWNRIGWAGARVVQTINVYKLFVGKHEEKGPLGISRPRWEDNL